jgi:hypothetical protein
VRISQTTPDLTVLRRTNSVRCKKKSLLLELGVSFLGGQAASGMFTLDSKRHINVNIRQQNLSSFVKCGLNYDAQSDSKAPRQSTQCPLPRNIFSEHDL